MEPVTIDTDQLYALFGIKRDHAEKLRKEGVWGYGTHFTNPTKGKVLYVYSAIKAWALGEKKHEVDSTTLDIIRKVS